MKLYGLRLSRIILGELKIIKLKAKTSRLDKTWIIKLKRW